VKKFVERVLELVQQANPIGLRLIGGENSIIYPPYEVGEDFIVGDTNPEGRADRMLIRFAAIGKIWAVKD
jgi:hypothetical protein